MHEKSKVYSPIKMFDILNITIRSRAYRKQFYIENDANELIL